MVIILSSADFHRLTIFDAGLPLSKDGYLSQRKSRVPCSLAVISSMLHRQKGAVRLGLCWDRHVPGNIPDKASEFARNSGQNTRLWFPGF
uniref:Uncharacterized protein n=1 Tax=Agrobacterium tumefaciens TaxID=358 RepID=A0A2Z2PNW0_AGRTU|nr:hypothetical protein [Agrobacterium tumefaciens]